MSLGHGKPDKKRGTSEIRNMTPEMRLEGWKQVWEGCVGCDSTWANRMTETQSG